MKHKMTIFGAGHQIALLVVPWLGMTIAARYLFPEFSRFHYVPSRVGIGAGLLLIAIGLIINFTSAVIMMRAFRSGRLLTEGPYGVSRNPMYASFAFLTIPGLALALDSWPVITASLAIYWGARLFVTAEERYLENSFGDAYREYRNRVGFMFPRLWKQ